MNEPTLTLDQVRDALGGLSTADLYRIADHGKFCGMPDRRKALDVVRDAIGQVVVGERLCPVGVPITTFLRNAMRSLISADLKKAKREVSLEAMVEPGSFDPASPGRDGEQMLIAKEEVQSMVDELERLFADDEDAQLVVIGDLDQMPAEEIRTLGGWDHKEFATIRKRIRRTIAKAYPHGWRL
ncbi:hypothetical protein [Methylopila sp. M107]|uniref:hypothetical protein n=1 Tax=Methylopila sp. M107 TaxID=1101190 RepID=UPI00058F6387|nr:hypothetical protein [Methylopila sp. M107]